MEPRPLQTTRTPLYVRGPSLGRRVAAVAAGLLLLGFTAWWLEWQQAVVVWLLFSAFVLLWPNWPPMTAAEERAQAWPFEP
jgi:hypothetical protein